MIKKQKAVIIFLCITFVLLLLSYFLIVKPLVQKSDGEETVQETVETDDGESIGMADKILVYKEVSTADIKSIEVHNEYGTYNVVRDDKDSNNIIINGRDGVAFDEEHMSSLMTSCAYPLAITKVGETDNLAEYGLVETTLEDGTKKTPAYFVMKTKTGETYKCLIGDKIVTGSGYYFMYTDRPNTVYVLDMTIADTLLAPVEVLVYPMIVVPMTQNDYFLIHDFSLMRNDELIVRWDYIEEEDRAGTEFITQTYKMTYPEGLIPSSEAISKAMYGIYSAKGLDKLEVVKLGIDDQALEEFNLTENVNIVRYFYDETENFILISPRNPDGSYYVASPLFQQIVKAKGDVFDFLTWDLFEWVENPIFQMKIDFVTDITVEAKDFSVTYLLEGEGSGLVVTEKGTGNKPDVNNFRQFYKTLLYASYEGQSNLMDDEMKMYQNMSDSECQLILTVHTESGRELKYRTYQYSERRSYVTLNGTGEFYILRTMADKIIADAKRVQSGEAISSTGKY